MLRRVVIPMLAVLAVLGLVVWTIGSLPRWVPGLNPATSPTPTAVATTDVSGLAKAKVVRVVDGDTLDASLDGVTTKLRLLNIDAPETAHDGKAAQCLAKEAKAKLAKLAPAGATVRVKSYGRDRFGRTLVGLYDEKGRLLNAAVVAAGLAAPFVVNGQVNLLQPIRAAQAAAAAAASGLHQAKGCTLPGQVAAAEKALAGLPANPSGQAERDRALAVAKKLRQQLAELAEQLRGADRFVPVDALTKAEVSDLGARVAASQAKLTGAMARLREK